MPWATKAIIYGYKPARRDDHFLNRTLVLYCVDGDVSARLTGLRRAFCKLVACFGCLDFWQKDQFSPMRFTFMLERRMPSRSCLLCINNGTCFCAYHTCCAHHTCCACHTGFSCSKAAISWIKDASPMVSRSCALSASNTSNSDQRNRSELFGSGEGPFNGALPLRTWISGARTLWSPCSKSSSCQKGFFSTDGHLLICTHPYIFLYSQ
jgi:hypothetical protein